MAASLLYFDIRGRGECIRLLFKHAGVEFEDRRIQFSEWPEIKAAGKFYVYKIAQILDVFPSFVSLARCFELSKPATKIKLQ